MRAPSYTVQKIEPPSGFTVWQIHALNRHGQVVGLCVQNEQANAFGRGSTTGKHLRHFAFCWTPAALVEPRQEWTVLQGYDDLTVPVALNDRGDVVGYAQEERRAGLTDDDIDIGVWPVLWVAQPLPAGVKGPVPVGLPDPRPLRLPGVPMGKALAINERREIVGGSLTRPEAALWRPTSARQVKLQRPPRPERRKTLDMSAINNRGELIACSWHATTCLAPGVVTEMRGYWWRAGRWVRLTLPGLPETAECSPSDLNEAGIIVGTAWSPDRLACAGRPWVWREGKGAPLSSRSGTARALNASAVIVGSCWADKRSFACVWHDGRMLDLNAFAPAGTNLEDAVDVNDRGQILVQGADRSAYLLTPR